MLYENRPNIVVDENYRMFVKEMQRRYAERGAYVYRDNEAIEQERKDAHARAMAPDAYRISSASGDAASGYRRGAQYMTTEDYLAYFNKCHDTFDAVNYYTLHKTQQNEVEDKVLVNRRMIEKVSEERRASAARRAPVAKKSAFEQFKENVVYGIGEFFAEMNSARKRAMTGMAAAALSLVFVIGGVSAFVGPDAEAEYTSRNVEIEVHDVVEVPENENLMKN
jgi:hypothetical protein